MRQAIVRWTAWGAAAWLVYGGVEVMLSTGVQLWRDPEKEILGWQWRWIGLLMGGYTAIGIVLGAAGAIAWRSLRRDSNPETARIFAIWSVTVAFAANLAFGFASLWYERLALAVAVLVAAMLAAALISQRQRKRFQFLADPWSASLLLLGPPWIGMEALGRAVLPAWKTAIVLAFLGAVVALAALVEGLRKGRSPAVGRQVVAAAVVFGIFVAVVLAGARGSSVEAAGDIRGSRLDSPNIVLIVMDTVRADHTSLYGYERDTTPRLRELAREATLYTRVIATSDFTLPTHASMFTGVYREWHGAFRPGGAGPQPLRADRTTLAEVLRDHGYWTASAVANFAYLAPWTGLTRGFAAREAGRPVDLSAGEYRFHMRGLAKRLLHLTADVSALDRETMTSLDIERRATALLGRAKRRGGAFFLFVNYMDAHFPYLPDAPFDARFSGKATVPVSVFGSNRKVTLHQHPLKASERVHLVSQYDGAIAEEDASIGRLVDKLRELALYDNALIIVTADHGEAFGEHELLQHESGFVYQDLVGVPLLIKYPHHRSAARSDELTSQVDLMPTILDAAAISAPLGLQGIDLLSQGAARARTIYSSASGPRRFARVSPKFAGTRRAIFSGSLKLITSTNGPPELYNLATDPDEEHNLYSTDDPQAADLSRRLDAWVQSMPHENARPAPLDPATRERLKSLGYVQ